MPGKNDTVKVVEFDPYFSVTEIEDSLRVAVKPAGADAVRVTVPLKWLSESSISVEVADEPAFITTNDGKAPMEKLGVTTSTVTFAE